MPLTIQERRIYRRHTQCVSVLYAVLHSRAVFLHSATASSNAAKAYLDALKAYCRAIKASNSLSNATRTVHPARESQYSGLCHTRERSSCILSQPIPIQGRCIPIHSSPVAMQSKRLAVWALSHVMLLQPVPYNALGWITLSPDLPGSSPGLSHKVPSGNSIRSRELLQLDVFVDCQEYVLRRNAWFLVIACSISSKLHHLSEEVLEYGGEIHRRRFADSEHVAEPVSAQETADPTGREDEPGSSRMVRLSGSRSACGGSQPRATYLVSKASMFK